MLRAVPFVLLKGVINAPLLSPAVFWAIFSTVRVLFQSRHFRFKTFVVEQLVVSLFFFSVIIVQAQLVAHKYGLINEVFRLVFPFLFSALFSIYLGRSKLGESLRYLRAFVYFLFGCSLVRVCLAIVDGDIGLYSLKYGSIFYPDSNFEGFIAFSLFLILSRLRSFHIKPLRVILFFVCLLSLSRAIIFTMSLFIVVKWWFQLRSSWRFLTFGALAVPIFFATLQIVPLVFNDGSFLTKVEIISDIFLSVFQQASWEVILFGVGSGNMIDLYGRESHNVFGLCVELGLFPMGVYLIVVSRLLIRTLGWFGLLCFWTPAAVSLLPLAYMGPVLAFAAVLSAPKSHTPTQRCRSPI